MNADYRGMSTVYRQLVTPRKFFETQLSIVLRLFEILKVPRDARILDAACGTGDVICGLFGNEYLNVVGTDGSPEMLAQWRPEFANVPHFLSKWTELDVNAGGKTWRGAVPA